MVQKAEAFTRGVGCVYRLIGAKYGKYGDSVEPWWVLLLWLFAFHPYMGGGTGCHGAYREKSFVHKPVFEGKCDLCHVAPLKDKDAENPHGQSSAGLLSGLLPKNNYGTYSQAAFSACFSTCHSPSAIEEPKTEDATRFRNGDDNLHFRHVARYPRGRSCILCHEPHQAENFALIDDHMDYGNEKLTLEFSITKHGGRCETSCHIPVEYDRDERVPSKMRLVEYR